ncbi:MAG: ACP S-malonyltransferase [Pseudomonadota bacterium]
MKKSAVVIFPGRGTYAKPELGYLKRLHQDQGDFIATVDAWRASQNRTPISELDAAKSYSAARHASSVNASALIYTCALCDFAKINRDKYEISAICGNSLGWYLSLAAAGALSPENAIRLVDTMGAQMEEKGVGGQIVYPVTDENWRPSETAKRAVEEALAAGAKAGAAHLSIALGGMAVLAGDEAGLAAMEAALPRVQDDRYPFRLARHAAFHTPLLKHVSQDAFAALPRSMFQAFATPLIDGRGAVWSPWAPDLDALYQYTLGHQIVEPYDFSKSVEVAIKEFAPDVLILAGPGSTLGVPIGQALIEHRWKGLTSKQDFADLQARDPFLLAMGREDQRNLVV